MRLHFGHRQDYGNYMSIFIYIVSGLIISVAASVLNLMFLSQFQGRKAAAIGIRDYYFTKKKSIIFILALLASGLGGFLGKCYGSGLFDVLSKILMMNVLSFLGWIDFKKEIVPNSFLKRFLIVAVIWTLIKLAADFVSGNFFAGSIASPLLGVAVMFIPMFLSYLISHGGVGAGDVKLLAIVGGVLGFRSSYLLLMTAFIVAAVFSVVQMLRKKMTMKSYMPFVPFLAIAMGLMVILGI